MKSSSRKMRLERNLIAALLAGAGPTGLQARETVPPTVQPQPVPTQTSPDRAEPVGEPLPQEMEFIGPDGEPLPPEIQRQLEEQLKDNPPPIAKPKVASPMPPIADDGAILVTGQRARGSVIGNLPPERTFNPLDIRAYGAANIGELIQELGPQVSSARGREDSGPVTLLNGRRVSSFAEIARIPTEAIERMEVFPEELALKYGYRADQKVVNVVTFERYDAQVGQLTYAVPTEGGRDTVGINANYFAIREDTRFDAGVDYIRSGSLLESDRGVLQLSGAPELGRFRTLLPETERLTLNGLVSGNLLSGVSSTLNGRFEASKNESLLGLGDNGPLRRNIETRAGHLGTTLGGLMGKWLWNFTGNYDRNSTDTFTDTNDGSGAQDEARFVNSFADADLVLSGPVLELPTGPISTSVRAGFEMRDFTSESFRGGVEQRTELSRDRGAIQANLDVPIASRRSKGAAWIGNLSVNANLEIEQFSDFGTLRTFGYGLTWAPVEAISLIASATNEEGAPTVEQLGAPLVETPNVRVFDFTRSEVVDITRLFGGNPNLRSDDRHVVKLGLSARPFPNTDFVLSVDYVATRIDNPIAPFPNVTPVIEAAFPERFTRDADGRLLRIDSRPLNFASSDQEQLRWGVNFTRPLGPVPPGMQNARVRFAGSEADLERALPPGARIIKPEPGSPMARRAENMMSRLFFSLYHTWRLEDDIVAREGGPTLDLLDGSAVDFRGGSRRHELEFQAGAFKSGLGARVTARWQSGTDVRGLGGAASDLSFSDFTTVDINLFANLADRFGGTNAPKWLKGTRVSIGINNLLNTRPEVRDEAGSTPFSYQPAYLDPLGRLVNFSLRKVF